MSSPDRIEALRQQRVLIARHLKWLDAEILAATGENPESSSEIPPPETLPPALPPIRDPAPAPSDSLPEALTEANTRADEIIERYRATEALNPADTKRSCLLLLLAVFLISTAIVLGIYVIRYR